jgi:hypothetical protein
VGAIAPPEVRSRKLRRLARGWPLRWLFWSIYPPTHCEMRCTNCQNRPQNLSRCSSKRSLTTTLMNFYR